MTRILIKVHEHYRKIVAVCDLELIGKKFEEGTLQLDVNEFFYRGKEFSENSAVNFLKNAKIDDACFNFVGENSVNAGIKAGLIDKESVLRIQNVPHALSLL